MILYSIYQDGENMFIELSVRDMQYLRGCHCEERVFERRSNLKYRV